MHFVDCIEGNSKSSTKFWGVIADSYNSTTDVHRQRTVNNIKDRWIGYNKQVSLFNQIYNQESSSSQNGAGDAIVLETVKQRYKNRTAPALVGSCEAPTQVEGKVGCLIHNRSICLLE
jgi:hypothetical protein